MSDQPEALRLADRLDLWGDQGDLLEAAAELRRQHDEIEQLKAERDALKAAAEKGTEYVLAHINQDLKAERDALLAEVERLKGVSYDLAGQLMVLRATKQMTATIDAAKGET